VTCPDNSEGDVITSKESSEEMDATRLEANPEATEAAVERQELLKEEINVDNIGSSVDRCEDRRLVLRRRRVVKKRIQDSVRSRQKLSAARKRVIRRAFPAVRKGNIRKGPGRNNVARGASKGKMLGKRQRNNCDCENGRFGRDFKYQLCLRMRRTCSRNYRMPMQLEVENRIVYSTTGV
jgi:hypothetical protein